MDIIYQDLWNLLHEGKSALNTMRSLTLEHFDLNWRFDTGYNLEENTWVALPDLIDLASSSTPLTCVFMYEALLEVRVSVEQSGTSAPGATKATERLGTIYSSLGNF